MSLNGISQNPLLTTLGRPVSAPATPAPGSAGNGAATGLRPSDRAATPERPAAPAARPAIASAPSTVPPEAPAGTDPALWSVLTTEERAFFARTATLGPLTYGKIKSATLPAPPAMRGGRLDVRA